MHFGKAILLVTLFLSDAGVTAPASLIPSGPSGAAFYQPPNQLPHGDEGSVIWTRRFTGSSALRSASANYRVLYKSLTARGALTAVSGTLAVPYGTPPPGGWPLISWAHGTTGNAPQCAPSRFASPDVEQRMLDGFVRRGYAVAQTDYEGIGIPGIHPYMVGISAANDVTDMARAAREIDPNIGTRWIVMGHSQGGAAALATAAAGQQIAPELKLVGAVAYAPFSNPDGLFQVELDNPAPNSALALVALLIAGFSTVDPRVVPSEILEPEALNMMPELEQRCLEELMNESDWARVVPRSIFAPRGEAAIEALYQDLAANNPSTFRISIPTLLVNGVSDAMVSSESTLLLRDRLSRNGTPVSFKAYLSATHGSVLAASANDVASWIAQRFATQARE